MARCMILKPKVLILDEPAAGLNPQETQALIDLIRQLRNEHKVSVLLIEHDMNLIMKISENILVVEYGRPIAEGTPDEIGHIEALKGIDLHIDKGEIVTLIGANGAGKSTLLNTVCGDPRLSRGYITYNGVDISHLPQHHIAAMGIALVPEGRPRGTAHFFRTDN